MKRQARRSIVTKASAVKLYEWIIAGTSYGDGSAAHFIVVAATYQDALRFFNEKYPKFPHKNFAARAKLSTKRAGHISHK